MPAQQSTGCQLQNPRWPHTPTAQRQDDEPPQDRCPERVSRARSIAGHDDIELFASPCPFERGIRPVGRPWSMANRNIELLLTSEHEQFGQPWLPAMPRRPTRRARWPASARAVHRARMSARTPPPAPARNRGADDQRSSRSARRSDRSQARTRGLPRGLVRGSVSTMSPSMSRMIAATGA